MNSLIERGLIQCYSFLKGVDYRIKEARCNQFQTWVYIFIASLI